MSVDPDEIRDIACDATATSEVCRIPEVPDPPNVPDLPPISPATGGASALGTLLVIVLVAAIVAVLAWMAWAWFDGRRPSDADPDDDELDDDLDGDASAAPAARIVDHERPPDRWRRAASDHRARGEFRDAVRCEYRALVGDLARAGFVDEIPGRTSGEERAQMAELARTGGPKGSGDAGSNDAVVSFAVAADVFDEAWFDDDVVTVDDDRRFVEAEERVLSTVMSGSSRTRSGSDG